MCAAVYRYRHLVKATKVNAGLAESSGRQLLGIWRDSLHVTCGLTACIHRDQLRAQRSVTSMGKLYLYFYLHLANVTETQKFSSVAEHSSVECVD